RRARQDRPRAARLRARGGGRGRRPPRGGGRSAPAGRRGRGGRRAGGRARAPAGARGRRAAGERGARAPARSRGGRACPGGGRGGAPPRARRALAEPDARRAVHAQRVPGVGRPRQSNRHERLRAAPRLQPQPGRDRARRGLRRDPRGRAGGVPMRLRWIVLLAMAALPACRREEAVESTAVAAERRLTPAQLSFLKFAPVAEVEATSLADLSGTIEFDEEHTVRLAAPVPGRVVQLLIQVGDRVDADQPLVTLESPEVKAAQADYVRADADLRLARKTAERATRLRAAQAIAEKDYLQAEEDAQKAAADFARARAQLERLRVAPGEPTSRYLLRAPLAGTAVQRQALVGMEASAESAEPLVVVPGLSRARGMV